MNFYELISEIESSRPDHHWDNLPYSFNQLNRTKLEDAFDIELFDLVRKAYGITIIYRSDQREGDAKLEYRKNGDEEINPFSETELKVFDSLDWTRLPCNLKAHINDVIWLCNHKSKAAKTAAEEVTTVSLNGQEFTFVLEENSDEEESDDEYIIIEQIPDPENKPTMKKEDPSKEKEDNTSAQKEAPVPVEKGKPAPVRSRHAESEIAKKSASRRSQKSIGIATAPESPSVHQAKNNHHISAFDD